MTPPAVPGETFALRDSHSTKIRSGLQRSPPSLWEWSVQIRRILAGAPLGELDSLTACTSEGSTPSPMPDQKVPLVLQAAPASGRRALST